MDKRIWIVSAFGICVLSLILGLWLGRCEREPRRKADAQAEPPPTLVGTPPPREPQIVPEDLKSASLRTENEDLQQEVAQLQQQLEDARSKKLRDAITQAIEEYALRSRANRREVRFLSPHDLRQFVTFTPEAWELDGDELVGRSTGRGDICHLTYATHFRSLHRVTVHGRIVPPSKENFRLSVGPVNLILNWEGADENHYRNGETCTVVKGHVLTPGKTHAIVVEQQGADAVVRVDENEVYRTRAVLEGTITVYPAQGSVIAISEVRIDGEPEPGRSVQGHSHANTY